MTTQNNIKFDVTKPVILISDQNFDTVESAANILIKHSYTVLIRNQKYSRLPIGLLLINITQHDMSYLKLLLPHSVSINFYDNILHTMAKQYICFYEQQGYNMLPKKQPNGMKHEKHNKLLSTIKNFKNRDELIESSKMLNDVGHRCQWLSHDRILYDEHLHKVPSKMLLRKFSHLKITVSPTKRIPTLVNPIIWSPGFLKLFDLEPYRAKQN